MRRVLLVGGVAAAVVVAFCVWAAGIALLEADVWEDDDE